MQLSTPTGRPCALLRALLLLAAALCLIRLGLHLGLEPDVICRQIGPITWEENIPTPWDSVLPELETGDVLVTLSAHSLGWRHGHCALVVDGQARLMLEATTLGQPSRIQSAEVWNRYPTLWLLRPAALTEEERALLGQYGRQLDGFPYALRFSKNGESSQGHCAALVWHIFHLLGYDVDGNGGWLVVPADLLECRLFDVIRLR